MNRKMRQLINMMLLPLLFAVLLFPKQAFAEGSSCTASIPVEVLVSGEDIPSNTEYQLVLEAVSENAPMPEKSTLTVKDGGKAEFGSMTYMVPGDYQYKIYQNTKSVENFAYDQTSYVVTVRVVNAENGGLKSEVWAVKSGLSDKADSIKFANSYKAPVKPSSPSKHHHSGSSSSNNESVPAVIVGLLTPQTGDNANLMLWGSLIAGCTLVLIFMAAIRKRDKEQI